MQEMPRKYINSSQKSGRTSGRSRTTGWTSQRWLCISPFVVLHVRGYNPPEQHNSNFSPEAETVSLLLSNRSISPNAIHPSGSGTTALHLAASIGRSDIVNLLLEQEDIDDTLRDAQGNTCWDVARGKEVRKAIRGAWSMTLTGFAEMLTFECVN